MNTPKKTVLGTQKRQTHISGGVLNILCAKCGRMSQILTREIPDFLKKRELPEDTQVSKITLEDCPVCTTHGDHKVSITE